MRLVSEVGEWVLGGRFEPAFDGRSDVGDLDILRGIIGCIFSLGTSWVMACMYHEAPRLRTFVFGSDNITLCSETSKR